MLIYCPMTSFSDWINAKLAERDISPAELARLMDIDSGVVSRILRGERKPGNLTIVKIAKALHIPPEDVFRAVVELPQTADDPLTDKHKQIAEMLKDVDDPEADDLVIAMLHQRLKQKIKQKLHLK